MNVKNHVDYDALHFHIGSVKSTFSRYSFGREGGGSQKKSTLCTLLIMLTIMDDPIGLGKLLIGKYGEIKYTATL